MAEVVLIHGIGQEKKEPDRLLRDTWIPAIQKGLSNAGPQQRQLADRLDPSSVALAFYGHLFVKPGAQGDDPEEITQLPAEVADVAEALAQEWIERAATRASDEGLRSDGNQALDATRTPPPDAEPMGPMALVRRAISALARIRIFAQPTFAVAEQVAWRTLRQVSLYMTNTNNTRDHVQEMLAAEIDDNTRVIISHSLGSVAAFEACHRLQLSVPLLITLGSPLGLDTLIWDRTIPSPPAYPPSVRWWVNVADGDDIVAATPALGTRITAPPGAKLTDHEVDNPFPHHQETAYLEKPEIAYPLALTLPT